MVSGAILALWGPGDSPVESFLLQDEARIQKVTQRLHTLEEVNNNVKLLSEMLLHYSREDSAEADKELMKVAPLEDAAAHPVVPNLGISPAAGERELLPLFEGAVTNSPWAEGLLMCTACQALRPALFSAWPPAEAPTCPAVAPQAQSHRHTAL